MNSTFMKKLIFHIHIIKYESQRSQKVTIMFKILLIYLYLFRT